MVIGSIYVPIRNRKIERKEKEQQRVLNAIWKKLDFLDDKLDGHMATDEIKSFVKHKIKESELKTEIKFFRERDKSQQ